ncbi:hypothetical protein J6590_076000 [Homalodisca vitripennis]|nr:hypothetical protein J6590_076000 [Homalodisca vitripennis]
MDALKYRDISDFQICLKNRSFQRLDGVGTVRYSRLGSSLVRMMKPAARPMYTGNMFSSAPRVGRLPLNVTIDVLLLTLEACCLAYVHRKHVQECPKGGGITNPAAWPMCTGSMFSSALRVGRLPLNKPAAWPMYTGSMFSSAPRVGRQPLNVTIDVLLLMLEACSLAYVHRKHVQQCPKGGETTKPAAWPMCTGNMFSSAPRVGRLPLNVTIDVLLLTLEACSLAYVHRKHVHQCPKGGETTVKRHY